MRRLAVIALLGPAAAQPQWSDNPANLLKKFAPSGTEPVSSTPKTGLAFIATWSIDEAGDTFTLSIEAGSTGWIGFGIAEAVGMRGADIMMGHVDGNGKAHIGDYHAIADSTLVKDGCQDWTVHHGEEQDGWTLLVVSRGLLTKDSNDRPILLASSKRTSFLAAFGRLSDVVARKALPPVWLDHRSVSCSKRFQAAPSCSKRT
jgi:hypothetical protein